MLSYRLRTVLGVCHTPVAGVDTITINVVVGRRGFRSHPCRCWCLLGVLSEAATHHPSPTPDVQPVAAAASKTKMTSTTSRKKKRALNESE